MRLYLSTRGMHPQRSGGSVAFYLRLAEHLAAENVDCHTGLMDYNADWFCGRLPERIAKHRISAADTPEGAREDALHAGRIGSDWMLFLFPHADDAYETAPAMRKACLVHDLQHLAFPQFFPAPQRWERDLALSRAARHADCLFTISDFTRDDLARYFPEAAPKTIVVSSAGALPRKAPPREPGSYILYPANFWPHKNHETLLAAFALLRKGHSELRLVLTGDDSLASKALREDLVKMAPAVGVTGYVDDAELDRLMTGANCLVFPSLFEGFAIPVVEAMARGIPVACSRAASLPEVGGELACYFDPRDANSIADAVRTAIELRKDAEFCSKLRRQAAKFSFDRTTRRILDALARPADPARPAIAPVSEAGNGRLIPLAGDLPAVGDSSWRPFPSVDCVWIDAGISQFSRDLFAEQVGLAEARSLHPSQCGALWFRACEKIKECRVDDGFFAWQRRESRSNTRSGPEQHRPIQKDSQPFGREQEKPSGCVARSVTARCGDGPSRAPCHTAFLALARRFVTFSQALRGQSIGVPRERGYEEMLSRVADGNLAARVRGFRGAPKRVSWPESWAVLASQLKITGRASPEAWNAVFGLNWHWSRPPGVLASRFLRKRTVFMRNSPGNMLKRLQVLGRFHLGRILFRLRTLFSFRLLLTNPRKYFGNICAVFTKGFRDHPYNQFGLFRQYGPREPAGETFPQLRTARDQLPGIALVTPSYQQGRYLESTIQSILTQDYPKLEYAVIDGGSDDESPAIIERYRNRLAFAASEKDHGQVYAIEKGFSRISGEVMAYLNSDDLLEPGALKFVGDFFSRNPGVDAIYGHRLVIDEAGKEIGRWVSPRYNPRLLRIVDYIPQETLFWRRSLYERVGGVDLKWSFALDWDLLLRFASAGARIVRVPYFLGRFRLHSSQKSEALINTVGRTDIDALRKRELGFCPEPPALEACYRRLKRESLLWSLLLRRGVRL